MVIYNPDATILWNDDVDDNSYRLRELMSNHRVVIFVSDVDRINFKVGCYLNYQGVRYTIRKQSSVTKQNNRHLSYEVVFDAPEIVVTNKRTVRHISTHKLKFPYTGQPKDHAQLIVDNLNAIDSGWSVGECIDAPHTLISYNHTKCWDALLMIKDAFNTEFEFEGKVLHIRKVEYNKDNPLDLAYGLGNGFKSGIKCEPVDSIVPIEILAVQGGSKNIDFSKYGESELLLPKNQQISFDGTKFEDEEGFNSDYARRYKVDADGLTIQRADKELVTFEDGSTDLSNIYPSRIGEVTGVEVQSTGAYDFFDTTIPENLNFADYRIGGEKATIIFQSGMLSGRTFDLVQTENALTGYKHSERRFMLVSSEQDGQMMPSGVFVPEIGDKYAVFGVMLPDAYIRDDASKSGASWDMFREAVRVLYQKEQLNLAFTAVLDNNFTLKNWINIGGKIKLGGYIRVSDKQLIDSSEIEELEESLVIRQTKIEDRIYAPYTPKVTLANGIAATYYSDFLKIPENEALAENNNRETVSFVKRGFRQSAETLEKLNESLLDFESGIKPSTVQTMMALFGDESLQFRYVNNKTNPSAIPSGIAFNATSKQLVCPIGIIQHMTLGITSISSTHPISEYKFWDVQPFDSAVLDKPKVSYFLYLRASQTNYSDATYIVNENAIKMDAESGYYHLLVGILNSEDDNGDRSFVELFGLTEILPGRITTDRIVSSDGLGFWDFVANAFKIGDSSSHIDWNNEEASTLIATNMRIKNALYVIGEALIAGLKFSNETIKSQTNVGSNPAFILDGINGLLKFNSTVERYAENGSIETKNQYIQLDSSNDASVKAVNSTDGDMAYLSSQGISASRAGIDTLPAVAGYPMKASIAGFGVGKMDKSYWEDEQCIIGVYGTSRNTSSNPSRSYGGYFDKLMANGLCVKARRISSSITITDYDVWVSCANTGSITVTLPPSPYAGRTLYIKRLSDAGVTINAGTVAIYGDSGLGSSFSISNKGRTAMLVYDGLYWQTQYLTP